MENETPSCNERVVRRMAKTSQTGSGSVEAKVTERKRRALEVLSDNTQRQTSLDSFGCVRTAALLHRESPSSSLCRTDNLAQPLPRVSADDSLVDDSDSDGIRACTAPSFPPELEDSAFRESAPKGPSSSDDPLVGSSVRKANKLLKGFRIDSTATSFSDDFPEKDDENERNDSFDSVIEKTDRCDSIGSIYTSTTSCNENSAIELTCSTSPVKPRPQASWDVLSDNHALIRSEEVIHKVPPNYMDEQDELDARMRSILIDWLVDVCLEFHLCQETLHTSVAVTDRFLASMNVSKDRLQLVGVVGVMIASKFEEIYPPKVKDFVAITDETYVASQLIKLERIMLKMFHFKINWPTINEFIATYANVAGTSTRTRFLAMYFGDLALQRYEFLQYLPSQVGAAAVWLSLGICESDWYNKELKNFCNYDLTIMLPIMERLLKAWRSDTDDGLRATKLKYTSDRFYNVALIVAPRSLPF
uniref:Cyclin N-terminal domain-containing protein n=1 Tax=Trichuris muris TaxID=70415 RepID=A0A5S6QUM2_TRIMR